MGRVLQNFTLLEFREKIKIGLPALVLVLVVFWIAYQFVDPAPPRRILLACGATEGAYFAYGNQYRDVIARAGITVDLRITAGAVENLELLETASGGVDAAFVQGGLGALSRSDDLRSLGGIFFEPLLIFHQNGLDLQQLTDLKGLRIAIGKEGSGTRYLLQQILEQNGVTSENTGLFAYGFQEAADNLLNGGLDVAMFISHSTPFLRELAAAPSITLMGMERADAYALRNQFLTVLKLPEGALDLATNIPDRDLQLVAPTAQLVVRSDLHPALMYLLLEAATQVHHSSGGFERQGEFPATKHLDFPLSREAERYYRSGPPFLQRYLPFWVAIFLTRMKIMLLPMIALVYPLFKIIPHVYRWRMRSRIYRWYAGLESVDPESDRGQAAERLQEYLEELDRIEEQVSQISVPLSFAEDLYHFRLHVEMLRSKLKQLASDPER
ncbi:hypothetical protein D3OALGA1CA_296 [Olavius algarvensis associated proteobacterium Delta 3]|nr:hypothetical protein D3OALGA1CA_296 [Olavius algarvensis associated proteobacterium Delta 3]